MTTVRIYSQQLDGSREGYQFFTSDWNLPRNHTCTYLTEAKGERAAEEAFHILNAPSDLLEEWQKFIKKGFSGPSLSVGDMVEVNGEDYLCCSIGWEKRSRNTNREVVASGGGWLAKQ